MIRIFYVDVGSGHKMAALAVQQEIESRIGPNQCEVLDTSSLAPEIFRHTYQGAYYFAVHYAPLLWGLSFHLFDLKISHAIYTFLKKFFPALNLKNFEASLIRENPEQIVFTHFLGIQNAVNLKKQGKITGRISAIVTDFFAHALWIHPDVDEYFVMNGETRHALIQKWGIKPERIKTTGSPISRRFIDPSRKKGPEFLKEMGLETNRLTLLFSSGAFGIGPTEECLTKLETLASKIQVILVTGNNGALKERLLEKKFPFPTAIYGFVQNMEELMDVSQVVVAKPGGITTCESLVKGLPMIISTIIPGQEEGNLKLLLDYDACWKLDSPSLLQTIISGLLNNPEILKRKKLNCSRMAKPHSTADIVSILLDRSKIKQ